MVGVPGWSKGCITCKRRKIKCDEGKPHCRRCSTASKTCEGYATDRIFVNQVGQFRYDEAEALASILRSETTSDLALREPLRLAYQGKTSNIAPIRCLSLEAFQVNICISFTTSRLFLLSSIFQPLLPARSWASDTIETDATSVIYYATCCLSIVFFARIHGLGDNILRDGAVFYGKALRRLNDNLHDPKFSRDPVNIAACHLLGMYEMSVFENGRGWVRHAGGIGRLLEMHGADFFCQEPAKGYFTVSRLPIIAEALLIRRGCFLDQEDWRTKPWTEAPQSKTSLDTILDLMACIPRLREESDALQSIHTHQAAVLAHEYRERLINFLTKLFIWRWHYEHDYPGMAFEVDASHATDASNKSSRCNTLYRTIFSFKQFNAGREPLLYNTALLMIFALATTWQLTDASAQALARIPPQESALSQRTNPLTLPHAYLGTEEVLEENCRSFSFFLQEPHAAAGAMALLLPLRMTYVYSKRKSQQVWLAQIMNGISRTCGFRIFEKLIDFKSFESNWWE
ncbi:MAG: hypothetical protein M1812_008247 [Candelaria pacifica]|nr:MAG: hypothetical protein M1812_008247 [Candelaria pacifica]